MQLSEIGQGNFGVARLAKDEHTGELVAIKFIERGDAIDGNVEREIINQRCLRHSNIVTFKGIFITPTHLAIVMEYASGGELFHRICDKGRFSEDEARYFFQQLVSGVSFCHQSGVCHRDLKLENTLLDGSSAPRLKICDFGYSKSMFLHSEPKSTVGTPAYIAPEVLHRRIYNGHAADVWSCGVTLYVMLVGYYPFDDPDDPRNFRKAIERTMEVRYSYPNDVRISDTCKDLLSRIFVVCPEERITMDEIRLHPWFQHNLPIEIQQEKGLVLPDDSSSLGVQSLSETKSIIRQARLIVHSQAPILQRTDDLDLDLGADNKDFQSVEDLGIL